MTIDYIRTADNEVLNTTHVRQFYFGSAGGGVDLDVNTLMADMGDTNHVEVYRGPLARCQAVLQDILSRATCHQVPTDNSHGTAIHPQRREVTK